MKVGFLTSSRAEFGIYLPLLNAMKKDPSFDIGLIVFGTHLSSFHGHTIDDIRKEGIRIDAAVETVLASDTQSSISTSMALTSMKFSEVWNQLADQYDLVFCIADRYEMFSAVSAGLPYGITFAHIHGGETSLGAIDNQLRHCISILSKLHFVTSDKHAAKVKELTGSDKNIYVSGSISLDNLREMTLLDKASFQKKYSIDLDKPTVLVTYHPETALSIDNEKRAEEFMEAVAEMKDLHFVITMPNADAMGNLMRAVYTAQGNALSNVTIIENFGTHGYFSCMQHAALVVGNSSSGIIEAASLKKYVVDIGGRQEGRDTSGNIIHANPDKDSIVAACRAGLAKGVYEGGNIYDKGGAAKKIIGVLKKWKP